MLMAVEAGLPGTEGTEWARVTLGELLLMKGDTAKAGICFNTSLELRPDYPFALAGKGKYFMARGAYAQAKKYTENAITIRPETAFVWQLADIEEMSGNADKALEINKQVVDLLEDGEKENKDLPEAYQHNGNRELASAYLRIGEVEKAISYAKKDLAYRPDNYDANELLAWALFQDGKIEQARTYAKKVVNSGIVNPVTAYRISKILPTEVKAHDAVSTFAYSNNYLAVVAK
jgi:tetratricopeptide (TPR) repeat protein